MATFFLLSINRGCVTVTCVSSVTTVVIISTRATIHNRTALHNRENIKNTNRVHRRCQIASQPPVDAEKLSAQMKPKKHHLKKSSPLVVIGARLTKIFSGQPNRKIPWPEIRRGRFEMPFILAFRSGASIRCRRSRQRDVTPFSPAPRR